MVTKTSHLPIRYFLALLWAHPVLHISTIRVKAQCSMYVPHLLTYKYPHCVRTMWVVYMFRMSTRLACFLPGRASDLSVSNLTIICSVLLEMLHVENRRPDMKPRTRFCNTSLQKQNKTKKNNMTLYWTTGNPTEIRAWYTPQVSGPPECYAFHNWDNFSLEMKLLLSSRRRKLLCLRQSVTLLENFNHYQNRWGNL